MKITTWQLIKMLWRKDDWHQVYRASIYECVEHKHLGWYYHAAYGCVILWGDPRTEETVWRIDRWHRVWSYILVNMVATRATRFARSHSYLPPEKQEEESWR